MSGRIYDYDVPSDGLTIDTSRGPVDLVVIERAMCGQPVRPNRAESIHLAALVPADNHEATQKIADACGVQLDSVLRRAARYRARQYA